MKAIMTTRGQLIRDIEAAFATVVFVELMALEGGDADLGYVAEQAWRYYWHKFSPPH